MRYLAGFIGGFVVAVLLLVFQQHLIGGELEYRPGPSVDVSLDRVFESRPPEEKPYEPRTPPPKPEPRMSPDLPVSEPAPPNPRPVPLDIPSPGPAVHGDGPGIRFDAYPAVDGGATVMLPVQPQYPQSALRHSVEGEVELEFTVLADGSVADVVVVRAEPRGVFEQSAVRAILRWQFIPKRENGVAVPVRARQVISFELPDQR